MYNMKRMGKTMAGLAGAWAAACLLSGCASPEGGFYLISEDETYETESLYELEDNKTLYEDEGAQVVTMYLTVGQGNEAEGTNHTWTEINSRPLSYYEELGIEPYKCEAVLQVGDEEGPLEGEFGYGERSANATVRLRGTGASQQQQKSYRIDIKQDMGKWQDQKVIVLNKHEADPVRIKNKLAYSLIAEIPQMIGARTTFVHLYVKDKTEGEDGLFRDYGLYTQVEQINKAYLRSHGFDSEGNLYQAGSFDWGRHADVLVNATDASYNLEAFEEYLEVKGSEDHSKLLAMLDAVNDETNNIQQVVAQYFNKENLYYWMAFHILLGNKDVLNGNYYLYSPRGVDTWYFISWDNDSMLEETYQRLRDSGYDRSWDYGIFNYADCVLFRRILQDETCRSELDMAVRDLRENYLTPERLREKIEEYAQATEEYLYELPDRTFARVTQQQYRNLLSEMPEEVEANFQAYNESLTAPWPFHILTPTTDGTTLTLQWEDAYSFQGDSITYTVELARDYTFQSPILSQQTGETSCSLPMLQTGQYFVRVRAANASGQVQDAYEYYGTEAGTTEYSTLCFYVQADGSVAISTYIGDD